jgi:hypothetical protein
MIKTLKRKISIYNPQSTAVIPTPPQSMASSSTVSTAYRQQWSENIKWKIP